MEGVGCGMGRRYDAVGDAIFHCAQEAALVAQRREQLVKECRDEEPCDQEITEKRV